MRKKREVRAFNRSLVLKPASASSSGVTYTLWDMSGDRTFYAMQSIFLTEYGLYLLVFNMQEIMDESRREAAVDYLNFWISSKKLHAFNAPVVLVGTHGEFFSDPGELKAINEVLRDDAGIANDSFHLVTNQKQQLLFFPVDNKSHEGIPELRTALNEAVQSQGYTKESVPVAWLCFADYIRRKQRNYLLKSTTRQALQQCGIDKEEFHNMLVFLRQRGMLTYFESSGVLNDLIVLKPQWLIEAITVVIFDKSVRDKTLYDDEVLSDFTTFYNTGLCSYKLLTHLWDRELYTSQEQDFFRAVMEKMCLLSDYSFEGGEKYIVPSMFQSSKGRTPYSRYQGRSFILDFTGEYSALASDTSVNSHLVHHIPFGMFEKLVCTCVKHSATYSESRVPELKHNYAKLSFGVSMFFELEVESNGGKQRRIRVTLKENSTQVSEIVKTIYSMAIGLKEDFSSSGVSIALLLSSETSNVYAEYLDLKERRESASKREALFNPNRRHSVVVSPSEYDYWFEQTNVEDNLTAQEDAGETQFTNNLWKASDLREHFSSAFTGGVINQRPLPNGMTNHCFLSYKQDSAIDVVGNLYYALLLQGWRCWYDQDRAGELTKGEMTKGVKESMCYILFLSKDIFKSAYVLHELETAVNANKPILLVHHPDTNTGKQCLFSDYIETAPKCLLDIQIFDKTESIPFPRRRYEKDAATWEISRRLEKILHSHQ